MSDKIEPLAATEHNARRPSVQQQEAALAAGAERRGSLDPTPNPMNPNAVTTENATHDEIPPTSSVGQQNAPGKGGEVAENIMGGLGYGGATVERPKKDQGMAEKIVNFLGA